VELLEPTTRTAAETPVLIDELAVHILIATEQVIKLLERIVRHGQGAADEVLVEAGQAAQRRLAAGRDVAGWSSR
jgi:hypothetical protein